MAKTSFNLDTQADAQVFSFGTALAGGDSLVTINKGSAATTTVVLDVKGSQSIAGDLNLTGNLNILGSINEQSVTNLSITDINITLNKGGTTAGSTGAGIFVEGDSATTIAKLIYDSTLQSKWKLGDGATQLEVVTVSSTQTLTNKTIGGGQISGNISGNAGNVTGTVLVGNGGTGATTLTGILKGNGTSAFTAASAGTDYVIPSGSITGTASNVTGTVLIANGGTGATTSQGAINATSPLTTLGDIPIHNGTNTTRLAGNITSAKQFLTQTGTGTNSAAPIWAAIGASDIPTLNQNTTGTAANVTGVVSVANGGTGLASITTGNILVGAGTSNATLVAPGTSGNVLTSNGSTWISSAPTGTAAYLHAVTVSGTQDSTNKVFTISNAVLTGSEQIFFNGQLLTPGASNDYIISGTTITFQAAFTAPKSISTIRVYGAY